MTECIPNYKPNAKRFYQLLIDPTTVSNEFRNDIKNKNIEEFQTSCNTYIKIYSPANPRSSLSYTTRLSYEKLCSLLSRIISTKSEFVNTNDKLLIGLTNLDAYKSLMGMHSDSDKSLEFYLFLQSKKNDDAKYQVRQLFSEFEENRNNKMKYACDFKHLESKTNQWITHKDYEELISD